MRTIFSILIILILFACSKSYKSERVFTATIYDSANILNNQQSDSILSLIKKLKINTGSELSVIIIDTLNGQSIEKYSITNAEDLRLGRGKYADGVLLVVSVNDRKMRVEVGSGLELILKDEIVAKIIREIMAPEFRNQKYGRGIYLGIDNLKNLIESNKNLIGKRPKL